MDAAGVIYMEDKVKESELIGKVHSAVYHQCQQRGYAAPAAVFLFRTVKKCRRFSVFPAVGCLTALKSYRHWSRRYSVLFGNPGSSGRFSVHLQIGRAHV